MLYFQFASVMTLLLSSVELVISSPVPSDEVHNVWKTLAPISTGVRQEHGTVALGNKIYIIGGIVPDPSNPKEVITVPFVDEYDIATNSWSRKADAPWAFNHPNVESANGKIYLLGGLDGGNTWEARGHCAVYDPKEDQWSILPDMPKGTERGSACTVSDGSKIYLVGGMTILELTEDHKQGTVPTVQSYDVKTRVWKDLPPLPQGRDHGGAAIIDGVFWQVGGRFNGQSQGKGTVFSLDLSNPSKWTSHAEMPTPRYGLAAAAVGSKIYTFGGQGDPAPNSNGIWPQVEVYDTKTDTWKKLADMPVPRHGSAARAVDGAIYIPGGGSQIGRFGENCIMQAFVP